MRGERVADDDVHRRHRARHPQHHREADRVARLDRRDGRPSSRASAGSRGSSRAPSPGCSCGPGPAGRPSPSPCCSGTSRRSRPRACPATRIVACAPDASPPRSQVTVEVTIAARALRRGRGRPGDLRGQRIGDRDPVASSGPRFETRSVNRTGCPATGGSGASVLTIARSAAGATVTLTGGESSREVETRQRLAVQVHGGPVHDRGAARGRLVHPHPEPDLERLARRQQAAVRRAGARAQPERHPAPGDLGLVVARRVRLVSGDPARAAHHDRASRGTYVVCAGMASVTDHVGCPVRRRCSCRSRAYSRTSPRSTARRSGR